MKFTQPQIQVIKEICEIEFKVLKKIIKDPALHDKLYNTNYMELLEQYGATKADYIRSAQKVYKDFRDLHKEPSRLLHLDKWSLFIFKKILKLNKQAVQPTYPKAWSNLWAKLNVCDVSSFELLN